jgi:hypothetical protein
MADGESTAVQQDVILECPGLAVLVPEHFKLVFNEFNLMTHKNDDDHDDERVAVQDRPKEKSPRYCGFWHISRPRERAGSSSTGRRSSAHHRISLHPS